MNTDEAARAEDVVAVLAEPVHGLVRADERPLPALDGRGLTSSSGEKSAEWVSRGITTEALHATEYHCHLGWEYTRTCSYLDDWPGRDTPPPGEGWEKNVDAGDNGHAVRTEGCGRRYQVSYWRRRTDRAYRVQIGPRR